MGDEIRASMLVFDGPGQIGEIIVGEGQQALVMSRKDGVLIAPVEGAGRYQVSCDLLVEALQSLPIAVMVVDSGAVSVWLAMPLVECGRVLDGCREAWTSAEGVSFAWPRTLH